MSKADVEYFRQRALEERARAETAPTAIIAEVHAALADKYEALIENPEAKDSRHLWSCRELPVATAVPLEQGIEDPREQGADGRAGSPTSPVRPSIDHRQPAA